MYQGFPCKLPRDPALVRGIAVRLLANMARFSSANRQSGKCLIWGYRFGPPKQFRFRDRMLAVIDYLKRGLLLLPPLYYF
jgi:hypothetical protein